MGGATDEGNAKDGAGRIALYKATLQPKIYTLEANYAAGKIRNKLAHLAPLSTSGSKAYAQAVDKLKNGINEIELLHEKQLDPTKLKAVKEDQENCLEPYTYKDFEEIGEVYLYNISM